MRFVRLKEENEQALFAQEAAQNFRETKNSTYGEGDPASGELLAIRWNPSTVLIVRLDPNHEPALYDIAELEPRTAQKTKEGA